MKICLNILVFSLLIGWTDGLSAQTREAYFSEAQTHLAFYLLSLPENFIAELTSDEKTMLTALSEIAVANNNAAEFKKRNDWFNGEHFSFTLEFVDQPELFQLQGDQPPRTAVTSNYEFDPVYINRQQINAPGFQMTYLDAVQLMIHEFGHKIRSKNQSAVDSLASKVALELKQYFFQYELTDGTKLEGILLSRNPLYEAAVKKHSADQYYSVKKLRLALENKELVLFETLNNNNVSAIQDAFYKYLLKYRGYEAKNDLHWAHEFKESKFLPGSILPLNLEVSPLSNDKKIILSFRYQVYDNILFPYRNPEKPIHRINSAIELDPKQFLKPKLLRTQLFYSAQKTGAIEFNTKTVTPFDTSKSIKVLSAGFIKGKEYEVVAEIPEPPQTQDTNENNAQEIFLVLQTDRGAEIFVPGIADKPPMAVMTKHTNLTDKVDKNNKRLVRFIYRMPRVIAANALYFDHFVLDNSQSVYASEGYRIKVPHLKHIEESTENSVAIIKRDIDLERISDEAVRVKVTLLVNSSAALQSINLKWKSVNELLDSVMTLSGYRERSSRFQIDEKELSLNRGQFQQIKKQNGWQIEFSYIDKDIPTQYAKNEYIQMEPDEAIYRVYPIVSEDSGDRWITELELTNSQFQTYSEKDNDGLIKYDLKKLYISKYPKVDNNRAPIDSQIPINNQTLDNNPHSNNKRNSAIISCTKLDLGSL